MTPVVVVIVTWLLNERSKRHWVRHKRKEESYRELLRALRGFYVSSQEEGWKREFLHQVNLCWLYSPDHVIRHAYAFLGTIREEGKSDEEKESAAGKLVNSIRRDLIRTHIWSRTRLSGDEFKHLDILK